MSIAIRLAKALTIPTQQGTLLVANCCWVQKRSSQPPVWLVALYSDIEVHYTSNSFYIHWEYPSVTSNG